MITGGPGKGACSCVGETSFCVMAVVVVRVVVRMDMWVVGVVVGAVPVLDVRFFAFGDDGFVPAGVEALARAWIHTRPCTDSKPGCSYRCARAAGTTQTRNRTLVCAWSMLRAGTYGGNCMNVRRYNCGLRIGCPSCNFPPHRTHHCRRKRTPRRPSCRPMAQTPNNPRMKVLLRFSTLRAGATRWRRAACDGHFGGEKTIAYMT